MTRGQIAGRRSLIWLADARRDLQYAVRMLGRAPGFTAAAVLTLSLGIGSITLIYSVIYNVLLEPLPYPNSGRLVNVLVRDMQTGRSRLGMSASELLDYKEQSSAFEDVIATTGESVRYTTPERIEHLRAVRVTPNFFDFMGLPPLLGRTTTPEDGRPDAPPVAVLRHRAWVTHFNADAGVVGRTILLNGEPRTIVGVMPPRFTWHAADLWIVTPLDRTAADAAPPRAFQARLKPGVTLREAEAQLDVIATRRARAHPKEYPATFQIQVVNVIAFTVGAFSGVLYTMLAAVALLMLIACCNVANMLLARAIAREREMTVRAALGAGRGRIIRQLLVESLLLALGGAAAGCLLAYAGIDVLVSLLPPNPLPGEVEIVLNRPALLFSLGMAVVSALLFGIAPALYSARRDLVEGLKTAGKAVAGGRGRLRNALVTVEIALSLVLLLGAGLLTRTFLSLVRADLGFDPAKVLVVPLALPPGGNPTAAEKHQFYQEALQRISSLPGVEAASAASNLPPFDGGATTELEVVGQSRSNRTTTSVLLCTPEYFRTLGIRIVRGEGLTRLAAGDVPRAVVVNQALVGTYFGGAEPLGQQIRLRSPSGDADPTRYGTFEIVGVVEDVKNQGIRDRAAPQVYLASATIGRTTPLILVRSAADPVLSANAIRREITMTDRNVAVLQTRTLGEFLDRSFYAQPRFSLIVLGTFAIAGTLLVAIGVFSVMAYTVSRQTREIAVRMALGATRGQVFSVVLRLGTQLLGIGIAVGLLASFATSRLLASQLWNTSPHDPLTTVSAVCIIAVVALVACYIPARRAMAVDPMAALRQE